MRPFHTLCYAVNSILVGISPQTAVLVEARYIRPYLALQNCVAAKREVRNGSKAKLKE